MRHRICCAAGLLLLLNFCATSRGALVFGLEMDQDPVYAGCTVFPGSTPGSHSVDAGGLLTMNSPSYYEFRLPDNVMNLISNSVGWSIDARFKFSQTSGPDMTFWVWDRTELNVINFGHTQIRVYGGPIGHDLVFPFNIDTNFHTYRIEAIGESVRVLVDGQVAVNTVHPLPGDGTHAINFGDGYESFSTTSVWDYYRLNSTIPEPAIGLTCLAGTVAAAVLRRRPRTVR
jgi:hypothetical protein